MTYRGGFELGGFRRGCASISGLECLGRGLIGVSFGMRKSRSDLRFLASVLCRWCRSALTGNRI